MIIILFKLALRLLSLTNILFLSFSHTLRITRHQHDFIIYGFSDHELMLLEISLAHTLFFLSLSMMNNIRDSRTNSFLYFYLAWHVIYKQYPFHFDMSVIWYVWNPYAFASTLSHWHSLSMKIKLSKHIKKYTHTHYTIFMLLSVAVFLPHSSFNSCNGNNSQEALSTIALVLGRLFLFFIVYILPGYDAKTNAMK